MTAWVAIRLKYGTKDSAQIHHDGRGLMRRTIYTQQIHKKAIATFQHYG